MQNAQPSPQRATAAGRSPLAGQARRGLTAARENAENDRNWGTATLHRPEESGLRRAGGKRQSLQRRERRERRRLGNGKRQHQGVPRPVLSGRVLFSGKATENGTAVHRRDAEVAEKGADWGTAKGKPAVAEAMAGRRQTAMTKNERRHRAPSHLAAPPATAGKLACHAEAYGEGGRGACFGEPREAVAAGHPGSAFGSAVAGGRGRSPLAGQARRGLTAARENAEKGGEWGKGTARKPESKTTNIEQGTRNRRSQKDGEHGEAKPHIVMVSRDPKGSGERHCGMNGKTAHRHG